jgi:hypothetical protein
MPHKTTKKSDRDLMVEALSWLRTFQHEFANPNFTDRGHCHERVLPTIAAISERLNQGPVNVNISLPCNRCPLLKKEC